MHSGATAAARERRLLDARFLQRPSLALGRSRPAAAGVALVVLALGGVRIIREDESGLVIKQFGPPLPPGRHHRARRRGGLSGAAAAAGLALRPVALAVQGREGAAGRGAARARSRWSSPPTARRSRPSACSAARSRATTSRTRRRSCAAAASAGASSAFLTAGTYRINPALFEVVTRAQRASSTACAPSDLRVYQVPADAVGIVTVLDGRPIPAGDLAGPVVAGHDSFQRGQAFIDAGGCRGLQEEVLLSGSWNLNPWFVQVELVPMTEIPIGYVGVVVSYVGSEHVDVSGDAFTHGDLVERGRKGVWVEPLLPGKHPLNTRVMKVELVPTTNIVLNWAQRTEAHHYDEQLSSILVRSKDGFSFSLDVVADHPHRHEERAARDLARRVDAEPGRPRAAADGRQLLPQLGAGGDGARVPVGAQRAPARGVRQHPARRSRRTTSSASTR